jgi:hypothetical protein
MLSDFPIFLLAIFCLIKSLELELAVAKRMYKKKDTVN